MPKIYMVEVGVELDKNHEEYDVYQCKLNGVNHALYDEDTMAFLDKDKAFIFLNEYVDKGVRGTYGVLWDIERKIETNEEEELINQGVLKNEFLPRKIDNVVFKGGLNPYA